MNELDSAAAFSDMSYIFVAISEHLFKAVFIFV